MTDVRASLALAGVTGGLPPPVTVGESVSVTLAFTDASGAAIAATGVTLTVTRPDGQDVLGEDVLTASSVGIWTASLLLNRVGTYVLAAACEGPTAAQSTDVPVIVMGNAAGLPLPVPEATPIVEARESAAAAAASANIATTKAAEAAATSRQSAYVSGLNELPIEWVQQDYAADLGGATLQTDAAKVIQKAWDLSGATGATVKLGETAGSNKYTLARSLLLRRWTYPMRFRAAARARLEGNFVSSGSVGLVYVENATACLDPATRPRQIEIEGGSWGRALGLSGVIFSAFADDLTLRRVVVDGYRNDRAYFLLGDRMRLYEVKFLNPELKPGGIRFAGGKDFRCIGAEGTSGDDCFQAVPGASGVWSNQSIDDFAYIDCVGTSTTSRVIVVGLVVSPNATTELRSMTASITRGLYQNISGHGSGYTIAVLNPDSSGPIRDIRIVDCRISDLGNDDFPAACEVDGLWPKAEGGGGVHDVVIDRLAVTDCYKGAVRARGYVTGLTIRDPKFSPPRVPGTSPIVLGGVDGFRIEGGWAEAGGNDAVQVGTSTNGPCTRGFIGAGFQARSVPNNLFAVVAVGADGLVVDGLTATPAPGATTSRGVYLQSGTSNCRVGRSDFRQLGHATPIANSGTSNTIESTNLGVPAAPAGPRSVPTYTLPHTGGTAQWVLLGTYAVSALAGDKLMLEIVSGQGYGGQTSQLSYARMLFGTSNGTSNDANGFPGAAVWWGVGNAASPSDFRIVADAAGAAARVFSVYAALGSNTGFYGAYTAVAGNGTWTHAGTLAGTTDPAAGKPAGTTAGATKLTGVA